MAQLLEVFLLVHLLDPNADILPIAWLYASE